MTYFIGKLRYHFKGFTISVKYAFIFVFLLPFLTSHAYHMFAPTHLFFEYGQPPIEIVSGNRVGGVAIIQSRSNYYKSIHAEWWDTMYCDGVKKTTQPWQDFMGPNSPKDNWEFSSYTFTNKDTTCQVCGIVQITTERGYLKKPFEYCSSEFDIEK